jgi:hypothetical protein
MAFLHIIVLGGQWGGASFGGVAPPCESMETVIDASFNLGWPLGCPSLIWGGHGHPAPPPLEPSLSIKFGAKANKFA